MYGSRSWAFKSALTGLSGALLGTAQAGLTDGAEVLLQPAYHPQAELVDRRFPSLCTGRSFSSGAEDGAAAMSGAATLNAQRLSSKENHGVIEKLWRTQPPAI